MKTVPSYPLWFLILLILAGTLLTASAIAQSPTASAGATVAAADMAADFAALGNPAAVHCKDMGYRYEIVGDNGQRGFCALPGGEVCDAWEFLQGKCGQSHSYCAKQGYQIRTVRDGRNPFSPEYAVCVTREGVVIGSVTELTNLSEKATGCDGEVAGREMPPTVEEGDEYVPPLDGDPPSSFDWRSYQGSDWLTPVKDQGGCGSCWAFSAVGVTESAHNIASNDPTLDKDLSEQYLVAGCSDSGTCCGGSKSSALAYIRDSGIPDESCLSYVDGEGCSCGTTCDSTCTYRTGGSCSDRTCSDRCGDWSSRLEYITSMGSVSTDLQTIKQALVDTGPLAVSMGYGPDYGGGWNGDIYRCTLDTGTNHAVVLVGYDDSGGYWWVRNSWGTGWGDNGYFKLGYGECYVEQYVYYANAGSSGGDAYEPDNTSGQASWIYDGSPQTHSIVPVGDVDWVKFTLSAESEVVIETSGTSGDTRMWLYDSGLGELEYDDDGGYGFFSQIDRLCGTDALPAGTYYVKIDEYGNDTEIPSYDITFTVVQTCIDVGPLTYDSYLIDDDNNGNSQGNDDGAADCGESIELYVDLLNQGTDAATGVDATLSTSDSYVSWLSNANSSYPDIAGGGTGTNSDDYNLLVNPSTPNGHVIHFDLNIAAGNGGPWTDSFDVPVTCVTNNPPDTPGSPSPADGATGVSTTTDLSWSGGDPDAGDAVTYDVYLGTSDPPTTLLCNDLSSTTCDPGTLSSSTHYYWYVVATDNHAASTNGPVWDFSTGSEPNNPPNTPGSPVPADGATGVSTAADLSWSGGDPDAGDTVTYDVYLGTSDPPTALLCNDVSSTTCDPGPLLYGTHYYWYVVATDNHATSTSGPVWDFSTTAGTDAYEPDNTSGQASWIYDGAPQTHSIAPVDDVDWVKFSLSAESEVVIETSGPSGDTRIWLYNSNLKELEFDDDGGSSLFSRIERLCGIDALPAGTYYVRIDEYESNDEIPSYDISFTARQACEETYSIYLPVVERHYR